MTVRRVVAIAVATAVCAPAAAAKSGERAIFEVPQRSGEEIVLRWALTTPDGEPFSALGVFVRLRPVGERARRIYARELSQGRYEARVRTPIEITDHLWVGLSGTTDVYFPVTNEDATIRAFATAAAEETRSQRSWIALLVIALTAATLAAPRLWAVAGR